MARRGVITYDGLPISSGGAHKLRSGGFVAPWAQIEHFLRACTDFERPEEIVIELIEGGGASSALVAPLKERFSERFSALRSRRIGTAMGHQWLAGPAGLAVLLQELETIHPLPDIAAASLTVNVTAAFRFVDPHARAVLLFQSPSDYLMQTVGDRAFLGSSRAFARLAAHPTVSVFFSLPFPEMSAEFRAYVEFLRDHAPFRLSDRHWKIWTLNRRGTRYAGRRLSFGPEPSVRRSGRPR